MNRSWCAGVRRLTRSRRRGSSNPALAFGYGLNEMSCIAVLVVLAAVVAWLPSRADGQDEPDVAALEQAYQPQVRPLLQRYCHQCHAGDRTEAEIDLAAFATMADVRRQPQTWQKVGEMLDSVQMPPKEAKQPTDAERTQLKIWVRGFLTSEARSRAGDPGPVVLRRLSNAEYTYTLRDLTGIESLDPAREFPVDGAAGEGFTNTGSALVMSPALFTKYLDAAKQVAGHAVLLPDGIRFSPHTTRRDWTDESLARIREFYRQFTDEAGGSAVDLQGIKFETNQGGRLPLERYLTATLAEREALTSGVKTLDAVASQRQLNAKYLATLWQALTAEANDKPSPLIDEVRGRWRSATVEDAPALTALVVQWQQMLWKFNTVGQIGRDGGSKVWMEPVNPITSGTFPSFNLQPKATETSQPNQINNNVSSDASNDQSRRRIESALEEFRQLFPPALCYTKIVPVDEVVTLTLFYREDEHLQRLMLNDEQTARLNRLWDELHFVSQEPLALVVAFEQISEFATQDRPDLVKAFKPLQKPINDRADAFRQRLVDTEPAHVKAVVEFADLACRRRLTDAEQQNLRDLYQQLRNSGIPHEEAIRLTLARVLTSPAFLYRLEQPAPGEKAAPVSNAELANRLSYFLWSSMPDEELRAAAHRLTRSRRRGSDTSEGGGSDTRDGSDNGLAFGYGLNEDEELLRQTRRMVNDDRTRRLAIHFACQWLHIRDFDQNNDKNEKLYPQFVTLRGDMYEESVRFFEDMFRNDGSILDLLDADHTFLNETLAKHYGIDGVRGIEWRRVDDVRPHGRGGILAMATVLASQSGASRTSPILRGNWVSETLLGERLPRPPANVPQLPDAVPSGLTARELIERHSSVPECAKCHARIDPYGFALEQYDAIGRLRQQPVDTMTKLIDGKTLEGINGLRDYLLNERRDAVVTQFCRKLLGYALAREVQLSDEPLLAEMKRKLEANNYRFSIAIEMIVLSDQFRNIRGQSFNP